jgi:uncharacterized protein YfiM (DUF2279 family)
MYQTPAYKSAALATVVCYFPFLIKKGNNHSCTFKALLSFFFLLVIAFQLKAQDSSKTFLDDHPEIFKNTSPQKYIPQLTQKQTNNRVKIIAATNIVGYSAAMAGLYAAWYKDYPQSNLHTFNDIGEWKGIDKIGHAYSAYAESKASMELWRWTGIERKKRIWIGGMSGAFYQTVIETLDGFSKEWGWSWGDFGANILGSGMLVAQELAWDEQRIQFKFSFHHKSYNDPTLIQRSNKIFGTSTAERFLKDYNGQTYWLSANLKSFFPKSKLPAWLQVSIGTGAEGMFGANENIGKDANGTINFSRTDIKRYRQWYLAPDIDLTKIKTNRKGIKVALNILNIVKFPMPSLEYSNGRFKFNTLTF